VHLDGGLIRLQHLAVGVGDDEIDSLDSTLDHRVDGVAAATAYSDDLDDRAAWACFTVVEFKHREISRLYRSHDFEDDANFLPSVFTAGSGSSLPEPGGISDESSAPARTTFS
jgi:hypothetical protein